MVNRMRITMIRASLINLAIAASFTGGILAQPRARGDLNQCARLETQWNGCTNPHNGDKVSVVNMRNDHRVRATIHHHGYYDGNQFDWDQVITIPAGGRVLAGCTGTGSNTATLTLVDCQVF
jgi:hypothetical protein